MLALQSPKLSLISTVFAVVSLLGCSSNTSSQLEGEQALTTAEGDKIAYESVVCIYRQSTGSDDTLSLQIQYLDTPDTVAFAVYIDDPRPAHPFRATPGEAGWTFEAALDGTMYGRTLAGAEATLGLDTLPAPATLKPGQAVRLRGRLDITGLSLAPQSLPSEPPGKLLELAAGGVPIDCEASYQESTVLD